MKRPLPTEHEEGRMRFEPFAVQLYRQFLAGYEEYTLAALTGICQERIGQRLRAAEAFLRPGRAIDARRAWN